MPPRKLRLTLTVDAPADVSDERLEALVNRVIARHLPDEFAAQADHHRIPRVRLSIHTVGRQTRLDDLEEFDVASQVRALPTLVLREIFEMKTKGDPWVELSSTVVNFLVRKVPLPDYAPEPEKGLSPVGEINGHDLADLVLDTGRLTEFDDLEDYILSLASYDAVDRYRSARQADSMLVEEPALTSGSHSSPSP